MSGKFFLCVALLFAGGLLSAQEKNDSSRSRTRKVFSIKEKIDSSVLKKEVRELMKTSLGYLYLRPSDTIINEKSAATYTSYDGRIIRHIDIAAIGFERSIYDSSKRVSRSLTRLANSLHANTRKDVIRNHLFIHENQVLNSQKVADNERFIRDKNFMVDCRIRVIPVENTDSVDLLVITRDVFSLGGSVDFYSLTAIQLGLYDANIDGRGQRASFVTLFDQKRSPLVGYAFQYIKSSVLGSLTDLQLGYSQLNETINIGLESEESIYAKLTRPLVSAYSRLAGGMEVSENWSKNVYRKPDSLFNSYRYHVFDNWLGYNLGLKNRSQRARYFLAFRYFDGYFDDLSAVETDTRKRKYNDVHGYLAELTFYRKEFYKTRYVLGFGRTEDIPVGITAKLAAGYVRQMQLSRPYVAWKGGLADANRKGDFYSLSLQAGSFLGVNNKMEDVAVVLDAFYYSRAISLNRSKLRNYLSLSYAELMNRETRDWLILNANQLAGLSNESAAMQASLYALSISRRLNTHVEGYLFTPGSVFGFRMAPFASADFVTMNCEGCKQSIPTMVGLNAGLRTRNENLIFGTMELKASYILPNEITGSMFSFGIRQNLRIKNTGAFATAPALITYN
jgi:hypothetical protein